MDTVHWVEILNVNGKYVLRLSTVEGGKFLITSGCTKSPCSVAIVAVRCDSVLTLNDPSNNFHLTVMTKPVCFQSN